MKDIRKIVNGVVCRYKTRDPFQLAAEIDIHIKYNPLPLNVLGYYSGCNGRKIITLNDRLDESIHRITVAHEIGHHFLHSGYNRKRLMLNTLYNKGKFERQADLFAAELLIADDYIYTELTLEQIAVAENIPDYFTNLKFENSFPMKYT